MAPGPNAQGCPAGLHGANRGDRGRYCGGGRSEATGGVPGDTGGLLSEQPAYPFLQAPDEVVVEMERNGGWLFVAAEADLKAASRKARKEGKVVTIRGRAAECPLPTVEIETQSYEELIEKWIA